MVVSVIVCFQGTHILHHHLQDFLETECLELALAQKYVEYSWFILVLFLGDFAVY